MNDPVMVQVTQEARIGAAEFILDRSGRGVQVDMALQGGSDNSPLVQAFQRAIDAASLAASQRTAERCAEIAEGYLAQVREVLKQDGLSGDIMLSIVPTAQMAAIIAAAIRQSVQTGGE